MKQILRNNADSLGEVYETIMADAKGEPIFSWLRGASYVKDNRLLPLGWKADHADGAATRPYGVEQDQDFVAPNVEAAENWIVNIAEELPHGIGRFRIWTHFGQWIGRCSLRCQADREPLIGFRILSEYWGQGFGNETAQALL